MAAIRNTTNAGAYFKRNLLGAQELAKTSEAERFCREALALQARLFRLWYRFRGDPAARGAPLTRAQLVDKVIPLQKKLFALGERYLDSSNHDVRHLATALFVRSGARSCSAIVVTLGKSPWPAS